MRNIISFMHISLDGFVAGPNGEMDWITVNEDIFNHVAKRISQTETALYGRTTYQMMESYWPTAANKPNVTQHDIEHSKWYSKVHKVVLSTTLKNTGLNNTLFVADSLFNNINELKQQEGGEILLFGSPKATHSLLQLDLIDGYWLFVNPVILGNGIPLFKNINDKIKLNLISTKQFDCSVTELNYLVNR